MPQQIPMESPIGRKQMIAQQADDGACLADVAERRGTAREFGHPLLEPGAKDRGGLTLSVAASFNPTEDCVKVSQKLGVADAAGEVEITDRFFKRRQLLRVRNAGWRAHTLRPDRSFRQV